MSLTQVQIEELQQVYTELLAECGGTFTGCQVSFATHRVTGEFALVVQWTESVPTLSPDIVEEEPREYGQPPKGYYENSVDKEAYRVLKHSTDADAQALWELFYVLSASTDKQSIIVSDADLQGRGQISVSELLDIAAKRQPV